MAKIVVAGSADCPYFAKTELLADTLVENLQDFKLHKIVIQPEEWETWLKNCCNERGWLHKRSPIVWRELVDRGGKGMLIGGANDFQEYAAGYYDVTSHFTSFDMRKIAEENLQTKIEVDEEERIFRLQSKPLYVCVTSASNPACYNMIHTIASGEVLSPTDEVALNLYDTEDCVEQLAGVEMEAFDLACPLLRKVTVTSDLKEAFREASVIILLDELLQGTSETEDDWLKRNHEHFVNYAKIMNEVARKDARIVLGGSGPINFNATMMIEHMPNLQRQNVVALSRTLENNAKAILADRLKVNSAGVVDVVAWGNINGTTFLDLENSRVHGYNGAIYGPPSFSVSVKEMIHDVKWLDFEFLELLKKRQQMLSSTLNHPPSVSQAAACTSFLTQWINGAPEGQIFSLGVCSEGWYDVPEGMVFSVPVTFSPKGHWNVVQDVDLSDENKQKIQGIVKELKKQIEVIYPPPYVPPPTPPSEPEPEPTPAEVTENVETEEDKAPENTESDQKTQESEQTSTSAEEAEEESDENKPALEKIEELKEEEEKAQTDSS